MAEIFPMFPQDKVIVSPNGIDVDKFKPREKDLTTVITEQTRTIVWPTTPPSEEDCKKYTNLVVVECMACKAPVIGANSGGPKDFVTPDVGELVAEPPETKDLSTVPLGVKTLGGTLAEAIGRALKENWKESKSAACIKLAHDKFTVGAQVSKMLSDVAALP